MYIYYMYDISIIIIIYHRHAKSLTSITSLKANRKVGNRAYLWFFSGNPITRDTKVYNINLCHIIIIIIIPNNIYIHIYILGSIKREG